MGEKVKYILVGVLLLGIGAAIGRYSLPAKVITETKIVEKEVEKKKIDKDKVTIITTTIKPDGTKVTETKIVDKSVITVDIDKNKIIDKETVTTFNNNNFHVSALIGHNFGNNTDLLLNNTFVYGISVEKRFIGPLYLGVWGMTDKSLGISAGVNL